MCLWPRDTIVSTNVIINFIRSNKTWKQCKYVQVKYECGSDMEEWRASASASPPAPRSTSTIIGRPSTSRDRSGSSLSESNEGEAPGPSVRPVTTISFQKAQAVHNTNPPPQRRMVERLLQVMEEMNERLKEQSIQLNQLLLMVCSQSEPSASNLLDTLKLPAHFEDELENIEITIRDSTTRKKLNLP